MDFTEQLKAFRAYAKLEKAEPLVKMIEPGDFKGIAKALDDAGKNTVDHEFYMQPGAHPHATAQARYNKDVLESPVVQKRVPGKMEGVSKKLIYNLNPDAGQAPRKVMVKPFHEKIDRRVRFWMQHLTQGWSEMANQALYHAAGIGHLHQTVHVSPHNMGEGKEKEPALVVHMDPGLKYAEEMQPNEYEPGMQKDLARIATMDFLTHNMDRHPHNLLYAPIGVTQADGSPRASRILAIDHGRSFQYKSSVKRVQTHDMFGFSIPKHEQADPMQDDLLHYLGAMGIQAIDRHNWGTPIHSPDAYLPELSSWWPNVRDSIVSSMNHQLGAIKDPSVRDHISRNFMSRVSFLDRLVTLAHNPHNIRRDQLYTRLIKYQRPPRPQPVDPNQPALSGV